MTFNSDIQQSTVQGLITLYELDLTPLGGQVYRFHGHDGVITWQGNTYTPIAIKADGLEMRGDGKASTPKLSVVDNINGIQGAVSSLCRMYDDFANARLKVVHTLAEYLNSTDENHKEQIWYIEQKTIENPTSGIVEFELSNPVDFEGQKIPVRQITSFCHWAVCGRYRGEECGYTGRYYTIDGKPTDDPTKDKCGGLLFECEIRHGDGEPLPFGGFPAAGFI